MNIKFCKFCGKELKTDFSYDDGSSYSCNCQGQKELNRLNSEIKETEHLLRQLKKDREDHIRGSMFEKDKAVLEDNMKIFISTYQDDTMNPASLDNRWEF